MAEDVQEIPAAQQRDLLQVMEQSPAFALFCEHWDKMLRTDIEAKIFDPATPPETTSQLKLVRHQLVETRHPLKVVQSMIRGLNNRTK